MLGAVFFLLALAWAGPLQANHGAVANLSATPDRFAAGDSTAFTFSGSPGVVSYQLEIYDANSDTIPVTTLVPSEIPAGSGAFSVSWGGATEASATPKNGVYTVTLTDTDGAGPTTTVTIATPPNLASLSHTPATLTPNGDGVDDVITVTAKTQAAHTDTLELRVFPKGNTSNPVWTGTMSRQADQMTFTATWDGKNAAEPPQVQPAGDYDLRVFDTGGGVEAMAAESSTVTLRVPLTISNVNVIHSPDVPGVNAFRDAVTVSAQFSEPVSYNLLFMDQQGRVVKSMTEDNKTSMIQTWTTHLGASAHWTPSSGSYSCTNPNNADTLQVFGTCSLTLLINADKTVAEVRAAFDHQGPYASFAPELSWTLRRSGVNQAANALTAQRRGSSPLRWIPSAGTWPLSAVQADQLLLTISSGRGSCCSYPWQTNSFRQPRVTVLYTDGSFEGAPPSGNYSFTIRAISATGERRDSPPHPLVADLTGPQITSFTLTPRPTPATLTGSPGTTFGNTMWPTADLRATFGESATWELWASLSGSDYNGEHRVWLSTTAGNTAAILDWDGRSASGSISRGSAYKLWLTARDALGNFTVYRLCDVAGTTQCASPNSSFDYVIYPQEAAELRAITGFGADPNPFGGPTSGQTRIRANISGGTDFRYWWANTVVVQWHTGIWKISIRPYGSSEIIRSTEGTTSGQVTAVDWIWNGRDQNGNRVADGDYQVLIEAWDSYGNAAPAYATSVSYDGNAPDVGTGPGGDAPAFDPVQFATGAGDQTTTFHASLTENLAWQLALTDEQGATVRSFTSLVPQQEIEQVWDGKSTAGNPVADGYYTWTFTVTDTGGNSTSTSGKVIKGNPGPAIRSLGVTPRYFKGLSPDQITIIGSAPDASSWAVTLRGPATDSGSGPVVRQFTQVGPALSVEWPGTGEDGSTVLPDGHYAYEVIARQTLPNGVDGATTHTGNVTIDRQAPVVTDGRATPGVFDPSLVQYLAVTAAAGDLTQVTWNVQIEPQAGGGAVRTFTSSGPVLQDVYWDGKVQGTTQFAADGLYYAKITATDQAGNASATISVPFRVDRAAPTVSNWKADKAAFQDGVTLTGTANEPVTWSLRIETGDGAVVHTTGSDVLDAAVTAAWDGIRSDTGTQVEATYRAFLSVQDAAGHTTNLSPLNITYDQTPPALSGVTVSPNPFRTSVAFKGSVNEASGANIKLTITAPATGAVIFERTATGTTINLSWNGTDTTGQLMPDGEYRYRLQVTDMAGNSAETSGSVHKDRVAPQVTEATVSPNPFAAEVTFQFAFSEPARYQLYITDSNYNTVYVVDETTRVADFSKTWDGTANWGQVPEGLYFYELYFYDQAGNAGYASGQVRRDFTSPVITGLSAEPTSFADKTSITATLSEIANWEVSILDTAGGLVIAYSGTGTSINREWAGVDQHGLPVAPGNYTVWVEATDIAGHFADPVSIPVSRIQPAPGILDMTATPDPFREQTVLRAELERPTAWRLDIKNNQNAVVRSYTGNGLSVEQPWTGTDSFGTPVPDGTYTYTVTVTSLAGTQQATRTVRKDTTAPIITTVSANPSTFTSESVLSATLAESDLRAWRLMVTDLAGNPLREFSGTALPVMAVWDGQNASGATLGTGTYVVRAEVTDNAGNTAVATGTAVRAPTAAPAVQNVNAAPNPFGGNTIVTALINPAAEWRLEFKNQQGQVLQSFTGNGSLVAQAWDGRDSAGGVVPDGTYVYVLTASNSAGATQVLGSVTKAGSGSSQPSVAIVSLSDSPDPFNPSGDDARARVTTITATFDGEADWTLRIRDAEGNIRKLLTGRGASLVQPWDGTDISGSLVSNGIYTYTLTLSGGASASATVERAGGSTTDNNNDNDGNTTQPVSISALSDSPDPFSPDGDGIDEFTIMTANLSREASWTLDIKDANGNVLQTFAGTGSTVSQIWNGRDFSGSLLPDGTYTYTLSVPGRAASATVTKRSASPVGGGNGSKGGTGSTGSASATSGPANSSSGAASSGSSPNITIQNGAKAPEISVTSVAVGPNPTRGAVTITAVLSDAAAWTLAIRDENGENVETASGSGAAIAVTWNGRVAGREAPDGLYSFIITATNSKGTAAATGSFRRDSMTRVSGLAVVPTSFSPNGDGILDQAQITADLGEESAWSLQIVGSTGNVVRTLSGKGLRLATSWDGTGDQGLTVPDGEYRLQLLVQDAVGNRAESSVRVRVDTTAPPVPTLRAPDPAKGDVPLSWGRGNGLFGFPDSPAAQTVSDPSGILKVEVWRAAGDHQMKVADLAPGVDAWTDDRVEPGTYQYRLRVVDRAGNAAASTPTRVVVLQGQGVCETIVVPGAATGCETPNGRIKVRIPAGAVSHGGRLMVVAAPPGSDYPELGRVKVGPPVQVQVVDDQGLPLTLQQSITLTLGYDPALVHDHRLLSAYVWRDDRSAWHYLGGSVDPNRREVAFSLKRPGVVAVMVDPDMPLFADVTELWAAAEVRGLAGHRITRGHPDNTFRPDNAITRSEFVTFLARAMGLTASPDAKLTAKDAADVPEWAAQAMLAATEAGLIKGFEDGTLRPHEPITRSQMMVVVVRALGLEGGRTSDLRTGSLPFADDASVPGWARGHVKLVTQLSELPFVRGGVFEPERNATRAETAWTLMLLLDRTGY